MVMFKMPNAVEKKIATLRRKFFLGEYTSDKKNLAIQSSGQKSNYQKNYGDLELVISCTKACHNFSNGGEDIQKKILHGGKES